MTSATLEMEGNLWPAVLLFSVTYIVISALVTAVLVIFDLNANSAAALGVLVAATAAAARKFVVDYRRPLGRSEQLRFAILAFMAIILITLAQAVVTALVIIGKDEVPALIAEAQAWIAANAAVLAMVSTVVVLVYFAVLYFASGWFSRLFDKRLTATGRI